jgi:hypothetical protein
LKSKTRRENSEGKKHDWKNNKSLLAPRQKMLLAKPTLHPQKKPIPNQNLQSRFSMQPTILDKHMGTGENRQMRESRLLPNGVQGMQTSLQQRRSFT